VKDSGHGEGLRCAKAWDSFSRGRGTLGINTGALGRANLASHRAGAVDRHGRTPAKPKLAEHRAKLGKLSMGIGVSPRGGAQGGLVRSPVSEREMCPWAISKYFGDLVFNTSA
jgi:hypothetical protein